MKCDVVVRPRAEADLHKAFAWYENQRDGLGQEFVSEIAHCVRLLENDPHQRPLYYRGFRRCLVRRFPYKLFYCIEKQTVVVFRVIHVSRDHSRLV